MKRSWIGISSVVIVAVAIVAYKQTRAVPPPASTAKAASVSQARAPSVLLVANPREAKDACGCGQIIRLVRKAGAEGVAIREVPPGDAKVTRKYHVTVTPTVLFLGAKGKVTRRFEGESVKTVKAVRRALAALRPPKAKK